MMVMVVMVIMIWMMVTSMVFFSPNLKKENYTKTRTNTITTSNHYLNNVGRHRQHFFQHSVPLLQMLPLALSSPGFMLLNEIILFLQLIFINDFLVLYSGVSIGNNCKDERKKSIKRKILA
mmetsp:Transcript_13670/g.19088  ORF Transcript_13670/g.19088 Transcript_13670/m.19088 type:complete len:121 (-) Transcript_13670:600-962(-)